jgi:light-harvesting protein B-800-850 alpha chain
MINGRMWCVVNPTVGIPLFLGAVAVGSFAVHVSVLTNTGWVSDFLSGRELGSTMAAREATTVDATTISHTEGVVLDLRGGETMVTLPDGRKARLVIEGPATADPLNTASVDLQ